MMDSKIVSRWGGEAQNNQESNSRIENLDGNIEDFDIDWFMGYLYSDQDNNKKMIDSDVGNNVEESRSLNSKSPVVDLGGGGLCFDELGCGDSFFDNFDIDSFKKYLDFDQEKSKKMNLGRGNNVEESRALTAESFVVMDSGVLDCSAADHCDIGGVCFDYFGVGNLCSNDLDSNWLMGYLDSDKEVEPLEDDIIDDKVVRRKFKFGDQELDEFSGGFVSGGDFCFDDLVEEDSCSDDSFIDWFMRCLDSDKDEEVVEDNFSSKIVKRKSMVGVKELDEFDGDPFNDEHCDLDIDWFIRCLDSDQEKEPNQDTASKKLEKRGYGAEFGGDFCCNDLGMFDRNWLVQILDSNQEESVEQRTISNSGKRKFEAEENSNRTKKMLSLVI